MKAYVISDGEGACIEFADNNATARRHGARELGLESQEVESCQRAPEFDQYAPGPVPLRATLAAGWWHYCTGCQTRFDQDERNYGDDDREDEFEPVEDANGNPYCSHTCMMQSWAERREWRARERAVIESALTKWPMALSANAGRYSNGGSAEYEYRALVTLPGIKYPVSWTLGASVVDVAQCDVDEFTRLYGVKP